MAKRGSGGTKNKEKTPEEKEHDKALKKQEKADDNSQRRRTDGRTSEESNPKDFKASKPAGALSDGSEIIEVLKPPPPPDGKNIQELVNEAGWEVAGVDWAFKKVTGHSIVETVIMPITGDFNKIQQNAEAWKTISNSMKQFSATMSGNADIITQTWRGPAGQAHKEYVDRYWKIGLTVEGKIADTIGKGFETLADQSQKLCGKALDLLKRLVDKILQALAKLCVPVAGWIAAASMIWDAFELYQKIVDIIDMVKDIIKKIGELWDSLKSLGSQLAKIKEIRNVGDLKQWSLETAKAGKETYDKGKEVTEGATDIKDKAAGTKDTVPDHDKPRVPKKMPERSGHMSGKI
ncbi:hypothetical protein [Amycolatopsis sp. CA-230715]|uniref:hypothetical protein n=1 Tax=Amycolatopsis sp. CA-230715 TaxID=2745196 RepID=UPI001C00E634|nr:hypothetical protein [Amycolatopsis sp. CA-230715]QWF83180.1 hypothetical protein HUW46_06620 [Amycolatopsis sp. CA-230715]